MSKQMKDLDGKVAIVTGAGIPDAVGAVTARALAEAGAKVVIADLPGMNLHAVRDALIRDGFDVAAFAVDLVDEENIKALVQFTVDTFGGLDIIDNNAAATHLVPHDRDLSTLSVDLFDKTMAINLRGPMLLCKHGIPEMIKRGGGSVINISSGKSTMGDLDGPAYAVSKAGLNMLSQMIATMHGHQGIRANTVLNGVIRTPLMKSMVPEAMQQTIAEDCLVPRLGEAIDIANAVVFLASDKSAYITGHHIPVDGGMLAHVPHYGWRRRASNLADNDMNYVD